MRSSRKLALVASDDDDESPPPPSKRNEERRKRKKIKFNDEDYVDEFEEEDEEDNKRDKKKGKAKDESDYDDDHEDSVQEDAKPIGDVIRVSGKGRGKRNHYEAFDYDGMRYDLEDPVLLVPEETGQKPYVAIIKDITQTNKGNMMVTGQWFYRPEEAEKKGGGNWQSRDARELFYSFHRDEVPAESVMHKCVVHFIPVNKQIPERKVHPGFIVQKVYDTDLRRLFKLTDKDYEDNKQHEIDLLVQKTFDRLGDVPDLETEDGSAADQEDAMRNKRLLRRKYMNMSPLDVSKEDEETRSGQTPRIETPGSCAASTSEYNVILAKFKALTGENLRDRWLEKLLQGIQDTCSHVDDKHKDIKEKNGPDEINGGSSKTTNDSKEQSQNGKKSFIWPDDAVTAVAALEKASHESFPSEFNKYNQKMRQLHYNLQKNAALARRLLNGELEPSKILNMSPNELKEGLTAEEISSKEPEESAHIQKTDARCQRCNEKKVVLLDIIQAGHGARYQFECKGCGYRWYSSGDETSTLTLDEPSSRIVGTAPLATAKFEDVEKLASPRGETEKTAAADVLKKTTQAYIPVLDKQKSLNKQQLLPKSDENVQQSITTTGE